MNITETIIAATRSLHCRVQRIFAPKPKRLELRFVTYSEGHRLVLEGWVIAREEDFNRRLGWVFLERLDSPNDQAQAADEAKRSTQNKL